MLNKKKLSVGSKITVVTTSWGLPAALSFGTASNAKSAVEVRTTTGIREANIGDVMEIVQLPKKIAGINCARVRLSDGVEGLVYWCELRASCNLT